jgi:predicted nucleotidyltransferase
MMEVEDVTLVGMTEDMDVNATLYGFVGLAQLAFPGRVLAYFMVGSQATSEAVGASDIDVVMIFKDRFHEREQERFELFRRYVGPLCRMPLDITATEEARLLEDGEVNLKESSLLLMGEDIRERIPLMPKDKWLRYCMHRPFIFMERSRAHADDEPLRHPFSFPDAQGELYGYDHREHVEADGTRHRSIKELVTLACRLATALVSLQAGAYTFSKRSAIEAHRQLINDEWTPLFEEIYACRTRGGYRVPADPKEREHLRALCARMLEAENHFLGLYKDYLLAELRRGELRDRVLAARRLGLILYPGDEVLTALREQATTAEEPLREEAREAISRLEKHGAPVRPAA